MFQICGNIRLEKQLQITYVITKILFKECNLMGKYCSKNQVLVVYTLWTILTQTNLEF